MSTRKKLPAHEIGTGNVFADLGLPNAKEHQLKAVLDARIESISVQEGQQVANRTVLITMAGEEAGGAPRPAMALRPQDG